MLENLAAQLYQQNLAHLAIATGESWQIAIVLRVMGKYNCEIGVAIELMRLAIAYDIPISQFCKES